MQQGIPEVAGVPARSPSLSVTVVIPCRDESRTIEQLLNAIVAQTCLPDLTIVVNDASKDSTVDVVRGWSLRHSILPLQLLESGGRGAAAAMNVGIAAAATRFIVRLDGHCLPAPDYVERCIDTLLKNQDVGVVGGIWRIRSSSETWIGRSIAAALASSLGSGGAPYRKASQREEAGALTSVDTVPFGAFSRDLWVELGGFDEGLLRNQDYDFNYRARLFGRKVLLNPAIVCTYKARPTLAALTKQYYYYGYWKMRMLRKYPKSMRLRQLLPVLLMPCLVAVTALALWSSPVWAWLVTGYPLLLLAGGIRAAAAAGSPKLAPGIMVALLALQLSWSAGAWMSLLKPQLMPRAGE